MEETIIEQGTSLWLQERLGKFTASECYKLMTDGRGNKDFSDAAMKYILEKVSEELTGTVDTITSEAIVWGTEQEHRAREWYEVTKEVKVKQVGFLPYLDYAGCSPDGLVGEDGGLEIKCPFNTSNHIANVVYSKDFKTKHKSYYWQCQMGMLVTDRPWWDFVSFDPRINSDKGLFINRIVRNPYDIDELKERLRIANEAKQIILQQFK